MTTRYKPKNTEVDALQLNLTNLGPIIRRLQDGFDTPIIYNVSINEDKILFIHFTDPDNSAVRYASEQDDYFVFDDKNQFDILAEQQFKDMFEPIKDTAIKIPEDYFKPKIGRPYKPFDGPWTDDLNPDNWRKVITID